MGVEALDVEVVRYSVKNRKEGILPVDIEISCYPESTARWNSISDSIGKLKVSTANYQP